MTIQSKNAKFPNWTHTELTTLNNLCKTDASLVLIQKALKTRSIGSIREKMTRLGLSYRGRV